MLNKVFYSVIAAFWIAVIVLFFTNHAAEAGQLGEAVGAWARGVVTQYYNFLIWALSP